MHCPLGDNVGVNDNLLDGLPVDFKVLDDIALGDKEFVAEILEDYRDSIRRSVDSLRGMQAASADELASAHGNIVRWSHDIKGSSASLGAVHVSRIGCLMEQNARRSNFSGVFCHLAEVELAVQRALEELKGHHGL
eukprot:CAMPEP_0177655214 /NCGR_PEP_ID=MMETSP0447-20121125/14822_1 /TAXON_ID=0 /ORGANISM="Stygamoeba regulata, Strain BSH-02190019" /LENGTH=135 /DNA_ID=CAMNT_0019159067 /DNA_START=151 /DNA_END=558 /DNA_ORIENTATION=+